MRKKKLKPVFGITEEWKFAREITDRPRTLKAQVRAYNDRFGLDEDHQTYIVSGSFGYKQTVDKDEIMKSIEKEERLARIRHRQASRRRKKAYDFFSKNERLPI